MTTTWLDLARPGGPLNPEQRGWHWLSCQNMPFLVFWNGEVLQDSLSGQRIKPDVLSPVYSYLGPALTPDEIQARANQVRREALLDAHQRALLYANTSHQHGHLPVDPHECAGQVAMEIAGSISAIDTDIRKTGYAFRRKVLETAAQKAEMVIATGEPWPNIPAAIRALKGEGDD